jgi:hypothetical protein
VYTNAKNPNHTMSHLIKLYFVAAHVAAQVLTLLAQPWHTLSAATGSSNGAAATGTIAATATVGTAAIAVVATAITAAVSAR